MLLRGIIPAHANVLIETEPRLLQDLVDVVLSDHLVEMHCQLVVIHAVAHDDVAMLQEEGEA